jgi:anti-sigma factor ChrR (cupin superfamily)
MSECFPALEGLFNFAEQADKIRWKPYKEGVEIYRFYGDGISGPTAALLKYNKGSEVPLHEHTGFEHILILVGTQEDYQGKLGAGTFIINQPGTRHRVTSEEGCIVLAIYERPVRFLGAEKKFQTECSKPISK